VGSKATLSDIDAHAHRVNNGLDLQKRLLVEGTEMPIIFTTGRADVCTVVQAMKAGAVECPDEAV
jgi:FixJ family two-component response regulator